MKRTDILIIGAGPGGLQLGYYLARWRRPFKILERGHRAGTFFRTMPRHRKLISVNKVHTGYEDGRRMRFDWNSLLVDGDEPGFAKYSEDYFPDANAMVTYLQDYADRHVPGIEYDCEVETVRREEGTFLVKSTSGQEYAARALVVATGVSRAHRPPIQGLELSEPYSSFEMDPESFRGKRVLIIGKGNSAFETADALVHKAELIHLVSPSPIRLAWNTHFPGHVRAVNNNFLDTYQLKIQNALLDAQVRRLRRTQDGRITVSLAYSHANGEVEDLVYDRVICCAGFALDTSIFSESCQPNTVEGGRFPALTHEFESTNVEGLYFVGTLTQSLDYKKTNSAFIHGFRYNAKVLAHILEHKLYDTPLPSQSEPFDASRLAERIIQRINHSSAQWQQFGFIGDVATVDDGTLTYYEDLPVEYIHHSHIGRAPLYAIVTLEFGKHDGDVFAIQRNPDVDAASASVFLHPVVRVYSSGGVLMRKLHLLENLFGEWKHPQVHERPLHEFLNATLASHRPMQQLGQLRAL